MNLASALAVFFIHFVKINGSYRKATISNSSDSEVELSEQQRNLSFHSYSIKSNEDFTMEGSLTAKLRSILTTKYHSSSSRLPADLFMETVLGEDHYPEESIGRAAVRNLSPLGHETIVKALLKLLDRVESRTMGAASSESSHDSLLSFESPSLVIKSITLNLAASLIGQFLIRELVAYSREYPSILQIPRDLESRIIELPWNMSDRIMDQYQMHSFSTLLPFKAEELKEHFDKICREKFEGSLALMAIAITGDLI